MALKIIQYFSQCTGILKNCNTDHISAQKCKGLPDKIIKSSATSDNRIASSLDYIVVRTRVKFDGQCLKQDQIIFAHKKIDFMILSEEIL